MHKTKIMTALHYPSAGEPTSLPLQRPPNPRQRILVAEDEPYIRRLNTEILRGSGYHADAAEDGAAAWNALQAHSYDLLLTDHNMPKLSGIELLKKLHAAHMAMPVIMATGTLPEEQLKRHPWLQIHATLLKPYTPDELLLTVKNVLYLQAINDPSGRETPPPNWQYQPPANGSQL